MFKFFSKKGKEIFASDDLKLVEKKALEYKKKENLKSVEITQNRGEHYKFV